MKLFMVQVISETDGRYFDTCWARLDAAQRRVADLQSMIAASGYSRRWTVKIVEGRVEDVAIPDDPESSLAQPQTLEGTATPLHEKEKP